MTTDQSLFNNGNPPVTQAAAPQNDNPLANLLANIKNEAGVQKYSSVEDALNGAAHAQSYIAQLKAEKAEAEAKAAALAGAADKTAALEATLQELMTKVNNPATPPTADIDPTKISEYVKQTLAQERAAEQAANNQAAVVKAFTTKFGAEAEAKFDAAAAELGMTRAEFNVLAAKSPKVVLKAVGIGEQAPANAGNPFAPPPSATSAPAFQPHEGTLITRNKETLRIGASNRELQAESVRAKQMVEELHSKGLSVNDLTNPKVFFKHFG